MADLYQISWDETEFERALTTTLNSKLQHPESERLLRVWKNAKDFLIPHVLEEIKATEPHLSDHGPRHIANVLNNAYHLLHSQSERDVSFLGDLSPYELYALGFAIMYHDVGNVFGREKHNQRIQQIFSEGFTKYDLDRDLRLVVNDIGAAHTGGRDASGKAIDTLRGVDQRGLWRNQPIRTQQLAAILRFADELAEGPQRASLLKLRNEAAFKDHSLPDASKIFHRYAECVSIQIDRAGARVVVRLCIELSDFDGKSLREEVTSLLDTFWSRIYVLNQERQYARYYTPLLEPFKAISIQVKFFKNHAPIPVDVQHEFNDLVVPQKPNGKWGFSDCPNLSTDGIWAEVEKNMGAENGN